MFCGHSTQFEGAQRLGNVFYIDTGAVFSQLSSTRKDYPAAALTMANMRFATGLLSGEGAMKKHSPIRVIHEDDASDPSDANGDARAFNSSWLGALESPGGAP